ncbi:hypothetical protein Dimus_035975 [Dionaea muscipula]
MKPFQRFLHFVVMKNIVPWFGKKDTTSFMDLTYMDHIPTRRLVNSSRVMMRHMSYVISIENHVLLYGDWLTMVFEAFKVPPIDKQGAKPKRYDFLEETFLTMCQPKRENGVWWIGTGEHKRRDDEAEEGHNDAPIENEEVNQQDFDWEVVVDEVELREEDVNEKVEIRGNLDQLRSSLMPRMRSSGRARTSFISRKGHNSCRRRPSILVDDIPNVDFRRFHDELERDRADKIQAELDRAQAENARLLALLQQAKSQHKP